MRAPLRELAVPARSVNHYSRQLLASSGTAFALAEDRRGFEVGLVDHDSGLPLGATFRARRDAGLAFSPDLNRFATTGPLGVTVGDSQTGAALRVLQVPRQFDRTPPSDEFVQFVHRLQQASKPAAALVATAELVGRVKNSQPAVRFGPGGRLLVFVDEDGAVRGWDVGTGARLPPLAAGAAHVRLTAFRPDGRVLAVVTRNGEVHLWDLPDRRRVATLPAPPAAIGCLGFDREGALVAAGGGDGAVRVYAADSGRLVAELRGHAGAVLGLAFLPGGERLATSGEDRTVRVWDLVTGQQVIALPSGDAVVTELGSDATGTRLSGLPRRQ